MQTTNPRDYIGYGRNNVPDAQWPNKARIAVQFVLNYEEGGENCVLHGDEHAETFLSEMYGAKAFKDRHMSMESLYEYGSRAGVWRILNEFRRRDLPLTVFGIATALQRNSEVVQAIKEANYDVVCHGLKWIHYQNMPLEQEREHMMQALTLMEQLLGKNRLAGIPDAIPHVPVNWSQSKIAYCMTLIIMVMTYRSGCQLHRQIIQSKPANIW